ncbi:MAG: thioredoxin [Geminicoccaceae bacterium]|nr:thioredoxin [Geminicoccaceae bacterium]
MQLIGEAQATAGAAPGDVIKDGSIATFAADVIEASMQVPVLVDFWAPWCGPCKQLTPVLERAVRQARGKVRLVKINIDENQALAQQLRVQSVPTVYAFVSGQPVTGFAGAQPESQIKQLIEKLTGGPLGPGDAEEGLAAAAQALDAGDFQSAAQIYGALLEEDPENPEIVGGFARCLIGAGELEQARAMLDQVPARHANHAAIGGARAALELAAESGEIGDPRQLQARLDRDADDHEARYQLATSLFLRGQIEPAMDQLVDLYKRDRAWQDGAARRQLVRFFDVLGPAHPQTKKGRRMLSTMLFS